MYVLLACSNYVLKYAIENWSYVHIVSQKM